MPKVESWVAWEGPLMAIKELNLTKICLEGDSYTVIDWIKKN